MFGYRSDGKKLKRVDPILRFTSYIMKRRYDAQVEMQKDIHCEAMDEFIKQKLEQGIKYNYMHIVIAGIVRMYALRPKLNRFIMSGRIYHRNKIYICFAMKKKLSDDSDETTIKLAFDGTESLEQIKNMIDTEIANNSGPQTENKTDKLAKGFLKLPHFILNPTIGFLKSLDKVGMLPKLVIALSPFHTSCFLTNMKSIGTNDVFHHLYDFGTTGLFVGMGKEKFEPCVDKYGNIQVGKILKLGLVIDERICDGFYYARSVKVATKHIENPSLLEQPLDHIEPDPEV